MSLPYSEKLGTFPLHIYCFSRIAVISTLMENRETMCLTASAC
jgi:hypothetical protein